MDDEADIAEGDDNFSDALEERRRDSTWHTFS